MFTGFSDATIDFLWELRFHNERPWFLEHKQVFLDTLDRPMKALAADVTAALEQAYPDRKWYLHVARIYRDARRLHGNGPYKENLWLTLRCDSSRGPEIPAFYFEITPHCKEYAFQELNFDEVYSIIRDSNVASQNVARRNGMVEVDTLVKHYRGVEMPHIVFRVSRGNNFKK